VAYQRLNQMAMQVLAKDGILCRARVRIIWSDTLRDLLLKNSRHLDRFMQIVEEAIRDRTIPCTRRSRDRVSKAFFVAGAAELS